MILYALNKDILKQIAITVDNWVFNLSICKQFALKGTGAVLNFLFQAVFP